MYGELIPIGGGDTIPLLKTKLLVGRRESCDIVLRFPNVSAHHCELTVNGGYWYVRDLQSRNGVKVNGMPVTAEKRVDPGDTIAIAKHRYELNYVPVDLGAVGPPPLDDETARIFSQSLLERAGLNKHPTHRDRPALPSPAAKRYDVLDDAAGQIKDPNKPV